jgi:hypothetical protein
MAKEEGQSKFVRVCSRVYVVIYILGCLYISLAIGEDLEGKMSFGRLSLMVIFAFVLFGVWALISLAIHLTLLWEFKKELEEVVVRGAASSTGRTLTSMLPWSTSGTG